MMSFAEKIVETIRNPKNAMKDIAEKPLIEEGVMIVGVYAVLSALAAYVQSYKITFVLEGFENMSSFMQSMAIFSVVSALIGPFVFWLIGTGIIHLISMALGGEGKFYPQMMTVAGYSMTPMLFASALSIALLLIVEPMTITMSAANPAASNEIYRNPYILASTVIGIIMQIWAAIILIFGVQSAHKLTPVKSVLAVGIPLAVILIPTVWITWSFGIS